MEGAPCLGDHLREVLLITGLHVHQRSHHAHRVRLGDSCDSNQFDMLSLWLRARLIAAMDLLPFALAEPKLQLDLPG